MAENKHACAPYTTSESFTVVRGNTLRTTVRTGIQWKRDGGARESKSAGDWCAAKKTKTYRVTAELKHAADGIPDDGTSEVSYVHFLGDIGAGEVHDHPDLVIIWRCWSVLPGKKQHV